MAASFEHIAQALVTARLQASAIPTFPGTVPATLEDAYAIQRLAIALWPDRIAGWKVGRLSPDLAQRFGQDRFVGPVFQAAVRSADPGTTVDYASYAVDRRCSKRNICCLRAMMMMALSSWTMRPQA
ncbi:hypothetical protein [Sphingobium sp.]|uniref:hypothetical protein n=1 Tax=Sphingobium sp. TaxID=1912891 RepID=UPI003BB5A174